LFTAQAGAQVLGASIFLVGTIRAILNPVTQLTLVNAFGGLAFTRLRTIEFVIWTRHHGAITLVCPVRTILVSIASPPGGDAKTVLTPELATVARREIAILFIRIVVALTAMIAFLIFLDTFLSILALKLGQLTRNFVLIAAWIFLITVITTIEISVTNFLSSDPKAANIFYVVTFDRLALVILVMLCAVVAVRLVTFVKAVVSLVTTVILRYAVGRVELVGSTREFAGLTVWWRAIVVFILSILAVLVIITDPSLRYALARLSTLELIRTTSLRHALSVLHHHRGLSVVWGNGTAWSTVTPFTPSPNMMTSLVHLGRAPGLMFCKMR